MIAAALLMLAQADPTPPPVAMRTGNEVLDMCTRKDSTAGLLCVEWIEGVSSGALVASVAAKGCIFELPKLATRQQTRDVIVKWIQDRPAERADTGALLAILALHAAFPCPADRLAPIQPLPGH